MNTTCSDPSTKLQSMFSKDLIKLEDNNSCTEQTGPRRSQVISKPLRRMHPHAHERSTRTNKAVSSGSFQLMR